MHLDQKHEIKPGEKSMLAVYLRVHVPSFWI